MRSDALQASPLLRAPLGRAFLARGRELGLSAEAIAEPAITFQLLTRAITDVSIWGDDHDAVVAEVLDDAGRLRPLAEAVVAQPGAAWWFAPLDREHQLALEELRGIVPPSRPPTRWERYAQKPDWGRYTSTDVTRTGVSSFLVGSDACAGDLGPLTSPVRRYRVVAAPDARVFSIASPEDWRSLCVRYPASYEQGQIVPDFAAAAADWDAVQLTLGGLLSSDQVRIDGPEGWTSLNGWDAEHTIWLRPAIRAVERLPDLAELAPTWRSLP